jgi:hypothetical protein
MANSRRIKPLFLRAGISVSKTEVVVGQIPLKLEKESVKGKNGSNG